MGVKNLSLDLKDKKIIRELNRNSRQSTIQIAKKTGLSKEVVFYRINNLIEKGVITQFVTYIDLQRLGYTFYNVFFKLKHFSKSDEKRVFERIKDMPEVGWFVKSRGEWKLVVCLMAKDPSEFDKSLAKVMDILGNRVIRYDFFIVIEAHQLSYKAVLDSPKEEFPIQSLLGNPEPLILKKNDLLVLKELSQNARITKNELSKESGLTLEMVRHSMKKLEKSRLIQAYKPILDVSRVGYSWHIMLIQFQYSSEKRKKKFVNFLKNQLEVYYIVKGVGNWGLMIDFHTKTLEDFNMIQDKINDEFEDLIGDEVVFEVLKVHKCTFFPENILSKN
ncbi:AsnC family transcriptional regulator [Candidatus Woesearchaeota archaeon]|nr:AsnC family transcriptional regulator [Candidatus Woesearchaeota archaeon]MBT3537835.1 AsnC family transcriptional regulator [Candidatus Woesearchaeota archaeon]MBT4697966.1 AsnC family transcriptional regulator [Candidatus Woesearchaeota archaeon]MBT7105504.1 AsnC family transcriptional regulator [Candidatus Woesearchaeota archaeon]MBT7931694.1 AsnC family transcriptional regulator [Candidatus Woesearchaeota archaeon]